VVSTAAGAVEAASVVVASHYPIVQGKFFATRIHPRRSYIVAGPVTGTHPAGMFINVSPPTRSFRTTPFDDRSRLLLVGGEGHRVGQEDDTESRYEILERFMHQHFAVGETAYRWSTQDNFTLDGLPFVGRPGGAGDTYVATGFAGWGMTNGSAAALAISDAIQGRPNRWAGIYDLERHSLLASAERFVTETFSVAVQGIGSHVPPRPQSLDELEPGQGVVISHKGADAAVSRSSDGSLRAVSASCTHMGCRVSWNSAESTWDCPCHGSRFAGDGRILHGPASKALKAIDFDLQ
jgi:nitrite reductase/ring-hydroxylating ferredoxin subunit